MINEYILEYTQTHKLFLFDVYQYKQKGLMLVVFDYEDNCYGDDGTYYPPFSGDPYSFDNGRVEFIRSSSDNLYQALKDIMPCKNEFIEIDASQNDQGDWEYKVRKANSDNNPAPKAIYDANQVEDDIKENMIWFPEWSKKDYFGPMSAMYNVDVMTKDGRNNFDDNIEDHWDQNKRRSYWKFKEDHERLVGKEENDANYVLDPNDDYPYITEPYVIDKGKGEFDVWYPPRTNSARATQKSKGIKQ